MLEHLTDEQIESYRKRKMSPSDLLVADEHFLSCQSCRKRLNESGELQAAFKNVKRNLQTAPPASPEHLEYQLLAAYVDNRADELDKEIVESHIELCADCANELKELQEFAAMLRASSVKEEVAVEKVSPWRRLLSLVGISGMTLETGGASAAFRLAGAVAMVLLIAAASIYVVYKVVNSQSGPIARGNENQSLPENHNESPNGNQQVQPDNRDLAQQGNQNRNEANKNIQTPSPTSVFAFLVPLARGKGGDENQAILKITPDIGFVDLQVEVKNADGKSFAAQLQSASGTRTLKASTAKNGVVSFRVPASVLSQGRTYIQVFRLPRDSEAAEIEAIFQVEKTQKR